MEGHSEKLKSTEPKELGWMMPAVIVCFVFISWGLSGWFLHDIKDRGTFGDMFGFINSLFSGLAFTGVIIAILLQRQELRLQREELKLTRDELSGQQDEMKFQNETLRLQRFENTFFQLLSLQQEIVNSFELRSPKREVLNTGRACFPAYYSRLSGFWRNQGAPTPSGTSELERIEHTYADFFKIYQSIVGHYFGCLYQVLNFVKTSNIAENDKHIYANLIRAQLSSNELAILFYHCLSDARDVKFKLLVEEYALLKNLPTESLLDDVKHPSLYKDSAYN